MRTDHVVQVTSHLLRGLWSETCISLKSGSPFCIAPSNSVSLSKLWVSANKVPVCCDWFIAGGVAEIKTTEIPPGSTTEPSFPDLITVKKAAKLMYINIMWWTDDRVAWIPITMFKACGALYRGEGFWFTEWGSSWMMSPGRKDTALSVWQTGIAVFLVSNVCSEEKLSVSAATFSIM